MARYVVPVVVLLAMVGGYVAGQEPRWSNPNAPETRKALGKSLFSADHDGNGVIEGDEFESVPLLKMVDLNRDGKVDAVEIDQWVSQPAPVSPPKGRTSTAGQVGRYVPFEGGRMLDTSN